MPTTTTGSRRTVLCTVLYSTLLSQRVLATVGLSLRSTPSDGPRSAALGYSWWSIIQVITARPMLFNLSERAAAIVIHSTRLLASIISEVKALHFIHVGL